MKTLLFGLALTVCVSTHGGTTYWSKAASNSAPPGCFTWCSDEALKNPVSVTPTANDGNTYVVLGSAKMTGTGYKAPVGTTWIFGKDGKNVGTSKARPEFATNGGVSLDFGACTVYGLLIEPNSAGTMSWLGTTTFIDCGLGFEFQVRNPEAVNSRGANLAGTFIADENVTVKLTRYGETYAGSTAYQILSGDFSAYKGRFDVSGSAGASTYGFLQLTSASAFGDPSVEMTDYIALGHNWKWEIDPKVEQMEKKGITLSLSASEVSMVNAVQAKPWTLTTPLYGKTGTLSKIGDGNLTLNTQVEIGNITVDEGTLTIAEHAVFAENTTLTVRNGAQVVSRIGLKIPNVTVIVEQGGGFSFDFTVPYDGSSVMTLDMSTLSAADWDELAKPVPVQLSQAITQPLNVTNRFAVAKFASALGVTAADFKDATPKTYGLPVTWFEVEADGNGNDILYLLARPAVYLQLAEGSFGRVPELLPAKQTKSGAGDLDTWSDGRAAHGGADYVVANGSQTCTGSGWSGKGGVFTFPGETLTYVNGGFSTKSDISRFKRLVEYDGVLNRAQGYDNGDCRQSIEGELELPSGTVSFTGRRGLDGTTVVQRAQFEIKATVIGRAAIRFTGDSSGFSPRFSGDGTRFAGTVQLAMTGRTALEFDDIRKILADRETADPRAFLALNAYPENGFAATQDTILEGVNYGIAFDEQEDFLSVAEGKTLTLNGSTRFQQFRFNKYGAGTLALGGEILYQYDGHADPGDDAYLLQVREGWVSPYAWNDGKSYRFLRMKFYPTEHSGLAVNPTTTDAEIAKYGMRLEKANAIQFADETTPLRVKLLLGSREGLPVESNMKVPVLTVPDALARELVDRIEVEKTFKSGKVTVLSSPADGLSNYTTFSVLVERMGLVLIFK